MPHRAVRAVASDDPRGARGLALAAGALERRRHPGVVLGERGELQPALDGRRRAPRAARAAAARCRPARWRGRRERASRCRGSSTCTMRLPSANWRSSRGAAAPWRGSGRRGPSSRAARGCARARRAPWTCRSEPRRSPRCARRRRAGAARTPPSGPPDLRPPRGSVRSCLPLLPHPDAVHEGRRQRAGRTTRRRRASAGGDEDADPRHQAPGGGGDDGCPVRAHRGRTRRRPSGDTGRPAAGACGG